VKDEVATPLGVNERYRDFSPIKIGTAQRT
jgi:hypothetical protein